MHLEKVPLSIIMVRSRVLAGAPSDCNVRKLSADHLQAQAPKTHLARQREHKVTAQHLAGAQRCVRQVNLVILHTP